MTPTPNSKIGKKISTFVWILLWIIFSVFQFHHHTCEGIVCVDFIETHSNQCKHSHNNHFHTCNLSISEARTYDDIRLHDQNYDHNLDHFNTILSTGISLRFLLPYLNRYLTYLPVHKPHTHAEKCNSMRAPPSVIYSSFMTTRMFETELQESLRNFAAYNSNSVSLNRFRFIPSTFYYE